MTEQIKKALDILGMPSMVTRRDIKERYRQLAKRYHPDLTGGEAEMMEEIVRAYEILMDYIDSYRFSFDEDEITRQFPEESHTEKFRF